MAKRGVTIRILTNSLVSNYVPAVPAGYSKYRKALLEGGIKLYEMQRPVTEFDSNGITETELRWNYGGITEGVELRDIHVSSIISYCES